MPVASTDLKLRKSLAVNDSTSNGGRKGYVEALSGVKYGILPRVTKAERTAGLSRFRKIFFANENASDEAAASGLLFLETPSNAGDSILIAAGTQTDTAAEVAAIATAPTFVGCGALNTNLGTSDTEVILQMEAAGIEFLNGGLLHIANKIMVSQTIDAGVKIGDSVTFGTIWTKITATDDVTYPNGKYIGSNKVFTVDENVTEEWLAIADNLYTDEVCGTGDGTTAPTLSTLTHVTNGICKQLGKRPVITAPSGGNTLTVNIASTGACSGDCSAGQLNMTTGAWTTPITWSGAITNDGEIKITYHENCFSYAGTVCTVELAESPANAYETTNTFASGVLEVGDIEAASDSWAETSASGTYDESTYQAILTNLGTVEDTFTIAFTSATTFTCSGAAEGSLGTGSTSADFVPINANTGLPYFTIDKDGWGGTWANGDTVVLDTHPAAFPFWIKEAVPAGTEQAADNLCIIGSYCE